MQEEREKRKNKKYFSNYEKTLDKLRKRMYNNVVYAA